MLKTFDLESVRHFADNLNEQLVGCNGEGMVCSTLDESIRCHNKLCLELWGNVQKWRREVFAGRAEYVDAVETIFKEEFERLVTSALPLAESGQQMDDVCFKLEALPVLQRWIGRLSNALANWRSPRRAVGPGARVTPSAEADAEIRARLAELPPLPKGWKAQSVALPAQMPKRKPR